VDTVANCDPSASTGDALGKNPSPAVKTAVRDAEITEAAQADLGGPGCSKYLQDSIQKSLAGPEYYKSR